MQLNAENIGNISSVPRLFCEIRKTVSNPIVAIVLLALSGIGLLFVILNRPFSKPSPMPIETGALEKLNKKNQNAIQNKSNLTRVLFYGSQSEQEAQAKKMANELGLKFHCFDARKLRDNDYRTKIGWPELLQRIAYSKRAEFVFISHADELYHASPANSQIPTILFYTGSLSKTLLLCLGFRSLSNVDPEIASRFPEKINISASSQLQSENQIFRELS
ncbi:MAG TPA: hypothetical protein VLE96_05525 [Chlamydiales bacterium]|nr:hypothetical protein [Chlamydiales bacterium]